MRTVISIQGRRLLATAAALAIVLAATPPAVAQSRNRTPDTQKSPPQDLPQVRPAIPRPPRPDIARPPRTDTPAETPKPPRPDQLRPPRPDTVRPPRTDTPPEAPRPPRPDQLRPPRPDTVRPPRTDTPMQSPAVAPKPSRPDISRPDVARPDVSRPDIARPTRPDLARPVRPDVPTAPNPNRPRSPDDEAPGQTVPHVDVTVLAIIATNSDNRVDPSLRDLAEQLKPTFRFSGYRLANTDTRSVTAGQGASLRLIGPYSLQVTPAAADARYVVLNVQALQGGRPILGLQLRLRPGTYQLLGGWPVSGNTLLAAVSARASD